MKYRSITLHLKQIIGFVAAWSCLCLCGCLEIEQDLLLNQDGSGRLETRYILDERALEAVGLKPEHASDTFPNIVIKTEQKLRQLFRGDGVEIENARFDEADGLLRVSFSVTFANFVNFMNTQALHYDALKFFRNDQGNLALQIDIQRALGEQIQFQQIKDSLPADFKAMLRITLPNMVLENNADSIEDTILTWQYTKEKLGPEVMTAVCEGAGLPFLAALPTADKRKGRDYVYDPKGKRDPFKPFIIESQRQQESQVLARNPLQRYDVSQLKLVAIIWQLDNPTAMMEDASGKGYIITKGTLIGKNDGIVSAITEKEVVVTEKFTNLLGEEKIKDVRIRLHLEEKERNEKGS